VRDYEESVDSYHGPKARVMTSNSGEDGPQLLIGMLETPRYVPIDGEERVGSVALTNVKVASEAKGVAECSIGSTKGSDG